MGFPICNYCHLITSYHLCHRHRNDHRNRYDHDHCHHYDPSRPAASQAVTWCALSLCIANSLNQQYGAAAPGDEKPGPFFGDPML